MWGPCCGPAAGSVLGATSPSLSPGDTHLSHLPFSLQEAWTHLFRNQAFPFLCVPAGCRERPNTQHVLKLMMKNKVHVSEAGREFSGEHSPHRVPARPGAGSPRGTQSSTELSRGQLALPDLSLSSPLISQSQAVAGGHTAVPLRMPGA